MQPSLKTNENELKEASSRWAYGLLVAALLFAWEGFFAAILGAQTYAHRPLIGVLLLALAAVRFGQIVMSFRYDRFELLSYAFFAWCVGVSAYSNIFIFQQDYNRWVFATYVISPILVLPVVKLLKLRAEDLFNGLLWAGVAASFLVVFDQVVHLPFMEIFVRGASAGIERRMVFLKTESAFAAVILLARLGASPNLVKAIPTALLLMVVGVNLAVVTESRLAIAALGLAAVITALFAFKGARRAKVVFYGALAASAIAPVVLWKYIEQAFSYTDYAAQDVSVNWRIRTFEYFWPYFERTEGMGFGVMSLGPEAGNFMSWANNYAGIYAGIGRYPMLLNDVGITAALMQFGWVGLSLTVGFTVLMAVTLMRIGRTRSVETFAVGALALAYMISPLPINFFTLEWSNMTGAVVWSLAALSAAQVKKGNLKIGSAQSRVVAKPRRRSAQLAGVQSQI